MIAGYFEMILRRNSAPHNKKIKTFPYHVHTSKSVLPSRPLNLIEVLDQQVTDEHYKS